MKLLSCRKIGVLLFCGVMAASAVSAQERYVKFDREKHDFGELSEDDGPVSTTFMFENISGSPIVITKVGSKCGCVTSEFSKKPIRKGEKGRVKLTFNSKGLPGKLMRSATVYGMVGDEEVQLGVLQLTGSVSETKDQYVAYRYSLGDLRMRQQSVDFGSISAPLRRVERIAVANSSDKPMTITFGNIPVHMECRSEPATIAPGETGDLVFIFYTENLKEKGNFSHEIHIKGVGGYIPAFKRVIKVKAHVK